ncbi:MAG: glycosyltransferase family 4 protein [Chloroflexi bacterium]|nr:glycosyltransferase family 4 protein [Chloroflexota bacterium]
MHILFLSGWFPYPQDNGSKIRIFNLLKGLSARHRVTLLTFSDSTELGGAVGELDSVCDRVNVIPKNDFRPTSPKAILGAFSPTPRSLVDTFSQEMARAISENLRNGCDMVIASEATFLPYSQILRDRPALLEDIELASVYDRYVNSSSIRRVRHMLTWLKTKQYVSRQLSAFRACTVVSERERIILRRAAPAVGSVEVVPNCIDFGRYAGKQSEAEPNSLIFTGSPTYSANYDAVSFFLDDILPIVKKECPQVRLKVTGKYEGVDLAPGFGGDGVELLGYVPDVRPLIAGSQVSIVPLRQGGGTRLKILEAMALGTPVVSTSKGAEGLDVTHGENILIADRPSDFAGCVLELLSDSDLRAKLGENGRELVRAKYNWESVMPRFLDLVERVAASSEATLDLKPAIKTV